MIILSDDQGTKVRGISPTDQHAALDPVPLKDGTWMLPEVALSDKAHADVAGFLATLPTVKQVDPSLIYDGAQPADDSAVAAKTAGKSYLDVGVRKAPVSQAVSSEVLAP